MCLVTGVLMRCPTSHVDFKKCQYHMSLSQIFQCRMSMSGGVHVLCRFLFLPMLPVTKVHVALLNSKNVYVAMSILGVKTHSNRFTMAD